MFYSFTKNHYIAPLHSCLMAKICNHTGIKMCGLEKDHRDIRLFLDECDMFEYNCDYKKAYSKVDDKLCTKNITELITENSKLVTSHLEEMIKVNNSSHTNTGDERATSNASSIQITSVQTKPESELLPIPTKSMSPVPGTTAIKVKCTCMDWNTILVSSPTKHECICTKLNSKVSSMRTAVDITIDTTLNVSETTTLPHAFVSPNVIETIVEGTYANDSKIPIATECTRGIQNSTFAATTEKQNTDSVTKSSATRKKSTNTVISIETKKRCTCINTEIPTSLPIFETHSTLTYLETEKSTTSSMTKIIDSNTTNTLIQIKKNTIGLETTPTLHESEIIAAPTKLMTSLSGTITAKCTCMDLQKNKIFITESSITSPQTKHECTCLDSHSESSSIKEINDKITHTSSTKDDSLEMTLTTVVYEDVDSTLNHNSCDKYPKDCKRPQTWETTVRGETRDFFQILRDRFGDRVKMLKDTTHWPQRMAKHIDNEKDAFHFGTHNET